VSTTIFSSTILHSKQSHMFSDEFNASVWQEN